MRILDLEFEEVAYKNEINKDANYDIYRYCMDKRNKFNLMHWRGNLGFENFSRKTKISEEGREIRLNRPNEEIEGTSRVEAFRNEFRKDFNFQIDKEII